MKYHVYAQIYWLSHMEGGRRKIPPVGTRYCPIIKINDLNMEIDWSVDFICTEMDIDNESVIDLSFLVPEAPIHLLKKDVEFELFEGNKKVANGIIL